MGTEMFANGPMGTSSLASGNAGNPILIKWTHTDGNVFLLFLDAQDGVKVLRAQMAEKLGVPAFDGNFGYLDGNEVISIVDEKDLRFFVGQKTANGQELRIVTKTIPNAAQRSEVDIMMDSTESAEGGVNTSRQNSSKSSSSTANSDGGPQLVQPQAKAVAEEIEKMLTKNGQNLMELNSKLGGIGRSTEANKLSATYQELQAEHNDCVHAFHRASQNLEDEAVAHEINGLRESVLQLNQKIANALAECFKLQCAKFPGMNSRVVVNANRCKNGLFLADELLKCGGGSVMTDAGGAQNMTLDFQLHAENSEGQTNVLSRLMMRGNAPATEQSGNGGRMLDLIKNLSGLRGQSQSPEFGALAKQEER